MRSLEDADCGTNTSGCEFGDRSPVAEPCDVGAAEIRQPSAALRATPSTTSLASLAQAPALSPETCAILCRSPLRAGPQFPSL